MLTTSQLASLRVYAEKSLTDTCDIERATLVPDGQGGHTEEWNDIATDVPCRLAATGNPRRVEEEVGGVQVALYDVVIVLPAEQDVIEEDRIKFGSRTFEVRSVAQSTNEVLRQVKGFDVS